jgi:thiopurine S-methyltransferase
LHAGPPFSISADEVKQHYQATYDASLLGSSDVEGGLKGQYPATEHVWLFKQR